MAGATLAAGWRMRKKAGGAATVALFLSACAPTTGPSSSAALPADTIVLTRQGAFAAGGRVIGTGDATLSCDHGYVEYQIPVNARPTALLMWHSSSTKVWQSRWDGGEGFQSIFLRRGYPVYLWDGPRVGRGNWGCDVNTYEPRVGRDQANFVAWRLGEKYRNWFSGVQFPTGSADAWEQATRARYEEFDTIENAQLQADAAAKALERIGPTVLVTNSAGGFRALLTALKSDNVKAIVAYENPGYVLPEGTDLLAGPGAFPPAYVSPEEFSKLTRIPIQLVFGDNIDKSPDWTRYRENARQFAALVNAAGGRAEVLDLPSAGLRGNTHIPFADLNNAEVADQLSRFLERNQLDR
jgi:hypothetical protein